MMQNKKLIIFLTILTSLLSLYYLSFSVLDAYIQRKATHYATNEQGRLDFAKKQNYLDSLWKEPVVKYWKIAYTYEEIKENALTLGLDLQGGMHVTLEVSPVELVKSLAGNTTDPDFLAALATATDKQNKKGTASFTKLFHQAYKERRPNGKLSDIFATANNRGRISREATDADILIFLDAEIDHAIESAFEIIRTRIDRFGTSQPNMQRLQRTNKIQIELPGVNNPERVRKLLQGVAQLRFWKLYEQDELAKSLIAVNEFLAKEALEKQPISSETPIDSNPLAQQLNKTAKKLPNEEKELLSPLIKLMKGQFAYAPEDVQTIQKILDRPDVKRLFPKDVLWLWDVKPHKLKDGSQIVTLYPIKMAKNNTALLTGEVITDARQVFDDRGKAAVSMRMNTRGAKLWKNITANHIGKPIVIALDDKVYSAPIVNTEIPNGESQITGNFTIEEAQDLANILKAGSLPAPVKITEEAIIGPTLSKVAQSQGIYSMLLGLCTIVLFILIYYAKGGFVANVALLFNVIFILGILAQFNASLTLAGIAGIVLTMGMSIDANVLIFERIREELRKGIRIKVAIEQGYQKAYSSIIDSNVTTFLTGAILYYLGQGPVRGFATTLMIGIVTSFFTAVFITKLLFNSWLKAGNAEKLTFSFSYNKNLLVAPTIDFLKKRKFFYAFSGFFIIVGLLLVIQQGGLNLGVDFTGGRSYVVRFNQPVETTSLKTYLTESWGDTSTEVKSYGATNVVKITTNYLIENDNQAAEEQTRELVIKSLHNFLKKQPTKNQEKATFSIASTTKVGPSIAGDIQASAKKSVFFSFIVIFGYIVLRFRKWQFGLAAVIALFHDSLMVIAAFAIARAFGFAFEIDQVFIAAILTIIGYSINDTVVIFDRIREMIANYPKLTLEAVSNKSINETLSRTLITSFTTFIAVLILFIWGGEVLKGFSFALLVGIVFGTYSSICIAAPLTNDFTKKIQLMPEEKEKVATMHKK